MKRTFFYFVVTAFSASFLLGQNREKQALFEKFQGDLSGVIIVDWNSNSGRLQKIAGDHDYPISQSVNLANIQDETFALISNIDENSREGAFTGKSNMENKEGTKYKNMVFLGGNYSQFKTTDGVGKTGMNFGYYRQSRIWKRFYLNYGIMYTNKKLDLINKKIRWSDVHYYSERVDIHLNYNILELNALVSCKFQPTEKMFISPIIGVGHAIFFKPESEIHGGSHAIYQDEPVEEYDYRFAFTDGPPIIYNSGNIIHFGLKGAYKRYFSILTYTNYLKMLPSAGTGDLILNEKISSYNFLLGIYF
ncbi:MAG TPA: hypothetical protein PKG96_09130 [Bacilli bacterium]|nr:hypothetical protein [Bacilli bacterium]HPM03123.1 hypothetical protein [Candidatus Cloacimonadota bacterium]